VAFLLLAAVSRVSFGTGPQRAGPRTAGAAA
jgi:hypothetical protein